MGNHRLDHLQNNIGLSVRKSEDQPLFTIQSGVRLPFLHHTLPYAFTWVSNTNSAIINYSFVCSCLEFYFLALVDISNNVIRLVYGIVIREETMSSVVEHEKDVYDTRDIDRNEITSWSDLEFHLMKYTQQMEELDEQVHPIPHKYDPESAAIEEARQILENYEDELRNERQSDDRVDLSNGSVGIANDPDHAKDHDDAYNVFKHDNGYTAQVHIADVTQFVEAQSALDEALKERGVTFYLGDNTRHMAPQELAQEVFSLAPGKDRLALTIEMEFDLNGSRTDTDIYESIVSTEHLTYTHADRILDASEEIDQFYQDTILDDDAEEFRNMTRNLSDAHELARKLRDDRWDESLIINDRDSTSSKIVEELMIEANSAAGDYIVDQLDVGLFRVEEEPDNPLGMTAAEVLADHGYDPEDLNGDIHRDTARTLNNFFKRDENGTPGVDTIKDDEEHEQELRKDIITNLERAKFEASLGSQNHHDGLEIADYAQITSPIRRLTDFWNHRMLKNPSELTEADNWGFGDVKQVGDTTTQQQMIADEASRVWYDSHS